MQNSNVPDSYYDHSATYTPAAGGDPVKEGRIADKLAAVIAKMPEPPHQAVMPTAAFWFKRYQPLCSVVDATGAVMIAVKYPAEDPTDHEPVVRLHALEEGVHLLRDPNGPEAKWLARVRPAPVIDETEVRKAKLATAREKVALMPMPARALLVAAGRAAQRGDVATRDMLLTVSEAIADGSRIGPLGVDDATLLIVK